MKRGVAPDAEAESEPTTELFALSDRELALVGLLSFDFRVPGVLALLFSGSVPVLSSFLPRGGAVVLGGFLVLVVVGVVLFSWAAGAAAAVVNYYDFHLVRAGDELQYERGLLQRYDGSIPFDKLQTLTVEDTPLKRYFGYATLLIETAGYAPGQSSGGGRGSEAAVPLAERDRVFALANAIDAFGDPDLQRPPKRVRRRYAVRYLLVVGVLAGVLFAADALLGGVGAGPLPFPWYVPVAVVPVVPFAAHLKWVHRGYWLGDHHVVTRNGVLKRQTKVVPYDRIQTVIDTRTIFQRRWRLATVTIDTAGSLSITGGDAAAVDVDEAVADDLRAELDERLRIELAERRARRTRGARSMATVDADTGSTLPDDTGVDGEDTTAADAWVDRNGDGGPTGGDATARGEDGPVGPRRRGDVDGHAADNDGFVWGEMFDGEHDAPPHGEPGEASHGDADESDDTDADESDDRDDRSG